MNYRKDRLANTIEQNQITALYMGQTDIQMGLWFPIQKMTWEYVGGEYINCITVFTRGAEKLQQMYPQRPHIVTLGSLDHVRRSRILNRCSFANRMPLKRLPSKNKLEALGLDPNTPVDPIVYVSRSGGYRYGDRNDLFPETAPDTWGNYNFIFRPVDCYKFASNDLPLLKNLKEGNQVTPLIREKVELKCNNQVIGVAPGYIKQLIKKYQDNLKIWIKRINYDVPPEYQFLCQATLPKDVGVPFSESEYQPIS